MSNTVPKDWSIQPLEEVIAHLIDFRGRTPKKLGMEWGGGNIRALSANNVQMGKVDFGKECYLASEQLYEKWMTKGDVAKNDLLFTMEAPLGNVALVPDDRKYILSQRVILMKPKPDSVTSQFLFQQLRSDQFQRQLKENSTGSTAVGIQQKRLIQLELVLPPLPEQQKIAAILSSFDDVIEKTHAQIDKLKDLKTGMMQELLTKGIGSGGVPHTEFKDSPVGSIPESWRHSTIGELVTKVGSGITPKGGSSSYVDFGVPLIRSQNVHPDGLRLDDVSYITDQQHQKMANSQLAPNDVLLNITGASIGRCYYLPADFSHGNVNQHVCIIRGKPNHIHPVFLTLFLNSEFGQRQIMSLQAGGNREGLNFQQVRAIKLPLPTLHEQQKIADSVSSIDQHIQKRRAKLSQANNLKKALMQDLLTGKVRVKVDHKESAVA